MSQVQREEEKDEAIEVIDQMSQVVGGRRRRTVDGGGMTPPRPEKGLQKLLLFLNEANGRRLLQCRELSTLPATPSNARRAAPRPTPSSSSSWPCLYPEFLVELVSCRWSANQQCMRVQQVHKHNCRSGCRVHAPPRSSCHGSCRAHDDCVCIVG